MASKPDNVTPTCVICDEPITDGKSVRLSQGWVHAQCESWNRNVVLQQAELARASGTHGPARGICSMCREETVGGMYHKIFDGPYVCGPCADKLNQGPQSHRNRFNRKPAGAA